MCEKGGATPQEPVSYCLGLFGVILLILQVINTLSMLVFSDTSIYFFRFIGLSREFDRNWVHPLVGTFRTPKPCEYFIPRIVIVTELLKSGRSGLIIVRVCHLSFREYIICTDSAIKQYFIGFKKSVQNCSRFSALWTVYEQVHLLHFCFSTFM